MCVAILNRGSQIPFASFHKMWTSNKDGLGMMYHGLQREVLVKRFMIENRDQLWDWYTNYYLPVQHSTIFDNLSIHFRYATHGDICADNTHPYVFMDKMGNECGLMHNGIMPSKYTYDNYNKDYEIRLSDTYNFVQDFLYDRYDMNRLSKKQFQEIEKEIGSGSKLIILNEMCEAMIFNEEGGTWIDDNWYSNTNWNWGYGISDRKNRAIEQQVQLW